jgi:ElaB/YqjD/DUF883 family membrane-anchored ribosome-binding protein
VITSPNSAIAEKRDLHVGGIGASSASAGLATMPKASADSIADAPDLLMRKIRDAVRSGGNTVRDNPWATLSVAALLGLTAGYFLSRRS